MKANLVNIFVLYSQSTVELDEQVDKMAKKIIQAIDKPSLLIRISTRLLPEFDKECNNAGMQERLLKKIYQCKLLSEAWEDYRVTRVIFNKG